MAVIKSVSINKEQDLFLEKMGLSASDLLQRSINDVMESAKISQKAVEELERKISFLQNTINKQRDFIEAKGLMDAFIGL